MSVRRACEALRFDGSTHHYKSRRRHADLKHRIWETCQIPVRYGYRRVHVRLHRESWSVNHKKTRRIYKELDMQLRNSTTQRRVKAMLRDDRQVAVGPSATSGRSTSCMISGPPARRSAS
jgi:putative transposase